MLLSEFALTSRRVGFFRHFFGWMTGSGSEGSPESPESSDKQRFALIEAFCGDPLLCDRLYELGLRPGIFLESSGRAPFGGPFLFRFQNTVLALRSAEAACIVVSERAGVLND